MYHNPSGRPLSKRESWGFFHQVTKEMKTKNSDWDQEKKLKKVLKGTNKAGKHRKSLYNMLSEDDDLELDFDDEYSEFDLNYDKSSNKIKHR